MKKTIKIVLIVVGVLLGIILLDSLQALIFNNNPIIGIETKDTRKEGILVDTYHCYNGKNVTKVKLFNSSDTESICGSSAQELEIKIKQNFEKMLKINGGISSSTYDYIQNEYYENIINLGKDAVPVLVEMYEKGEFSKNGLDANISVLAIEEITKCDIKDVYGLKWSTPEEFYKLWKDYNCEFYSNTTK